METVADRIRAGSEVDPATDCWVWVRYRDRDGYGRLRYQGKPVAAYRASFEAFIGPIASEQEIDHLCRNRACVNPAHLEPVTKRVNMLRGAGFAARNAQKTHCPQGHELVDGNLVGRTGRLHRECLECNRQRNREYKRRKRAERALSVRPTGT